jgi:membrane protein
MHPKWNIAFFRKLYASWSADQVPSLAAALAYYTIFSLCPLLIICISVGGFFLEKEMVEGQVFDQIRSFVGEAGVEQIKTMVALANRAPKDWAHGTLSVVILLFGASGFFGQLQTSMNSIWHVKPPSQRGFLKLIKDRLLSLALVLSVAFILLGSLTLSTALTVINQYFSDFYFGSTILRVTLDFLASVITTTILFALIFKVLPDVDLQWKDVGLGAFLTAILFALGKILLSYYLTKANIGNTFGAAGALIIILVWVFYSAQILFLGAEFTKLNAKQQRTMIKPTKGATHVSKHVIHDKDK